MKRWRITTLVLAVLLGPACGGGGDGSADSLDGGASVAPDRPAPAISNPASPTPVGTDVGSVSRDTSGGAIANDSMALPKR